MAEIPVVQHFPEQPARECCRTFVVERGFFGREPEHVHEKPHEQLPFLVKFQGFERAAVFFGINHAVIPVEQDCEVAHLTQSKPSRHEVVEGMAEHVENVESRDRDDDIPCLLSFTEVYRGPVFGQFPVFDDLV